VKSYDPLDPRRLHVDHVHTQTTPSGEQILVEVRFVYQPWEPSDAQDRLWETRNAITLVSKILESIGDD
jgi:hypothetical protein